MNREKTIKTRVLAFEMEDLNNHSNFKDWEMHIKKQPFEQDLYGTTQHCFHMDLFSITFKQD